MRTSTSTLLSVLMLTAGIAQAGTFNQACLDSESIMVSVQQPAMVCRTAGHRGQLSTEDLSQMAGAAL